MHITVVEEGAVRFKFMLNFRYALYSILKFKKSTWGQERPLPDSDYLCYPPPPQPKKPPKTNKQTKQKEQGKNPSKSLYSGLGCGT